MKCNAYRKEAAKTKKLRELREKRGLKQGELAKILGVGRTTVTLWERGVNKPRADMLPSVARALRCTIDELLCHET